MYTSKPNHIPNTASTVYNPTTLTNNQPITATSSNYRKFQHRRIHTQLNQAPQSNVQVSSKYQPYQYTQISTIAANKKDISKNKLDAFSGYNHIDKNISNVPSAIKQSTHKAAISSINTANSNNKQIPSAINKNYKYVAKPTGFYTKQLKTQPDLQDDKTNRHKTNNNGRLSNVISNGKYQIQGIAGKGTFGVVYFGKMLSTGQRIALKKVLQDKKYKNRELQILKQIKHPNILEMKDYFITTEGSQQYLNVVMEYFGDNLYQIIKKKQMNPFLVKLYIYQVLRGLNYLSMLSISHRDIKPQNILVDKNTHKVVICDFGSAKRLIKGQPNIAYICSRCYRAPQLIFGATEYSPQIDMWSTGCVIVQMINGQAPFLGDSQIDQLLQIIKILGTPQKGQIEQMNPKYDIRQYKKFPNIKKVPWKKVLKTQDQQLIDLVSKILEYSPKKRLSAAQAMNHPYFDQLKQLTDTTDPQKIQYLKLQKIKKLPQLFNFTREQVKSIGLKTSKTRFSKQQLQLQKQGIPNYTQTEYTGRSTKQKRFLPQRTTYQQQTSLNKRQIENTSTQLRNLTKRPPSNKQANQQVNIQQSSIKLDKYGYSGYGAYQASKITGSHNFIQNKIPATGVTHSSNMITHRVGVDYVQNGMKGYTNRFQYR